MNNFTVIITSYNRQKSLLRTLEHLTSHNLKFKIIIADSSKNFYKNLKLINLIKKNKILIKSFKENTTVAEKIAKTLEYVETKYSVLSPDDDFIMPQAIKECVSFLDRNNDYSCCHGKYFIHSNYKYTSKYGITYSDLSKNLNSAEEDLSSERVKNYLDYQLGAQYTFYAVFKTEYHKEVWQNTKIYANNWGIQEYASCIFSLIIGKMKSLPIFFMSREKNNVNWFTRKKINNAFSDINIFFLVNGVIDNIINYENNIDNNSLKISILNFLINKKKILLSRSNNNVSSINKDNIFKKILRPIYYMFLKKKFAKLNLLEKEEIKKMENLILKYKDINIEIDNSRNTYDT